MTTGGTTTVQRYAIDGWNPAKSNPVGNEDYDVWADLDGSSSLTTRYLRGDNVDQLLGRVDTAGGAAGYWTLTDSLGSVRDVIDNTATVKDSIQYDAFGNINTSTELDPSLRGRYAFTGREFDVETQLQYNRARYYDATTGRWISQDPMGFNAGDRNLYRYASNQPVSSDDPSGNVVFFVHGVMDDGVATTKNLNAVMQPYWAKNGYQEQTVFNLAYGGDIRTAVKETIDDIASREGPLQNAAAAIGKAIKVQTTVFAATSNLDKATPAIRRAANKLQDEIVKAIKANPGQPINVVAHSNGTMGTLLALYNSNIKVDNLVLLASPLNTDNGDNYTVVKSIIDNNLKPNGKITVVFSENDLVTGVVGGAQAWGMQGVDNVDLTKITDNFVKLPFPSIQSHTAFTKVGNVPFTPAGMPTITNLGQYYASLIGWKK